MARLAVMGLALVAVALVPVLQAVAVVLLERNQHRYGFDVFPPHFQNQ